MKLYRGYLKHHSCKVWFQLAEQFQRRRLKCEELTDDRQTDERCKRRPSAGFAKLHMGLVVLAKNMSVLINFLLQNTNFVSVLFAQILLVISDRTDNFANSASDGKSSHDLINFINLDLYMPLPLITQYIIYKFILAKFLGGNKNCR
jgi:hypothetical protein